MTDYKVNFQDLKAKVGIDDVAYALGYRLDRRAGVGRYMELVLGDGKEKRDVLVICHPQDKASQRFFRRDGSKGDVVTLIRENLSSFTVSGKDEWQKIAKVLSRFANMPEPEYRDDREYVQSVRYHATFDSSRYEVKPINPDKIPAIFQQRGLSDETVRTFAPFIRLIRDRKNENFDGYNIGFPYINGENNQEKYNQELIDRFNHGELMHADSIHFPDSLKYQTKKLARTVYGGGGIMPDFFVPIDTTQYTDYHRNLVAKGVVIKTTMKFIEKNRKELQNKYKKFETFNDKFEISDEVLANMSSLADQEKIKFDEKQYQKSLPLIKTQLKALIARDLWDMNEYFQIMNTTNNSVLQALKVLNEGAYEKVVR